MFFLIIQEKYGTFSIGLTIAIWLITLSDKNVEPYEKLHDCCDKSTVCFRVPVIINIYIYIYVCNNELPY